MALVLVFIFLPPRGIGMGNFEPPATCRMSRNGPCCSTRLSSRLVSREVSDPKLEVRLLLPVRDTQLFCEVIGNGPTILTFHGGLGLDHGYLRPWLDPLGNSARLVFFDLRGHGRSGGRDTLAHADHATLCADADCLREQLTTDRVLLFGHSYGGFLALEYALRYPEQVAGLVLCSTSASARHAPEAVELAASRGMPAALAALRHGLAEPSASDSEFAETWRSVLPLYFHRNDPERAASIFAKTIFSAEGYNRAFFAWLAQYDVRERLGEIDAPTLVLSGADDWIMPPQLAGNELTEGLRHAEQVVFEHSGHFPFIEEPERFTEVVDAWLRKVA
jgi:proline iminopeptidase